MFVCVCLHVCASPCLFFFIYFQVICLINSLYRQVQFYFYIFHVLNIFRMCALLRSFIYSCFCTWADARYKKRSNQPIKWKRNKNIYTFICTVKIRKLWKKNYEKTFLKYFPNMSPLICVSFVCRRKRCSRAWKHRQNEKI